ncbi:Multisite-specific tRNA:(cytosine-C(5))-methyltransferase [Intoshia linei]|uniref:Multisite-specific tRNA:(Cytosine-C(5))-methyltransferase n=1 Tax=Intoshia linei TaxID=1819745 RepID=A0A177B9R4_9BILA|nr:Multisite-specific tRNA:(cytosine-C(5))-methyltransferase [Intoshia linei]
MTKRHKSTNYKEIEKENHDFEKYYKLQKIFDNDNEYEKMMKAYKNPLKITFSISNTKIGKGFENYMNKCEFKQKYQLSDGILKKIDYLDSTYQLNCEKKDLRKSVQLNDFFKLITSGNEMGILTRQEIASMIPVYYMDIQKGDSVLELCAAPGSKSVQISNKLNSTGGGFLVANDIDQKRCYTLVHRLKSQNKPNIIILCGDARSTVYPVNFDKVLCDVPCCGDGTLRKNLKIWKNWQVNQCISLSSTQCDILRNGCVHAKIGGRIVYSTCSMNPLENESVVKRVIDESKGSLKIISYAPLKGFISRPGLTNWKVFDKNFVQKQKSETNFFDNLDPSTQDIGLEKCVRIYPHDQDTGGFFLVVIEKVAEVPWIPKDKRSIKKDKRLPKINREDPFIYMTPDWRQDWENVNKYFNFMTQIESDNIFARSLPPQSAHITSKEIRKFFDAFKDKRQIKSMGTVVWRKIKLDPYFRFVTPSLEFMEPEINVKNHTMAFHGNDLFMRLMEKEYVECSEITNTGVLCFEGKAPGPYIFKFKIPKIDTEMYFSAWIGATSVGLFVNKDIRTFLINLLDIKINEIPSDNQRCLPH